MDERYKDVHGWQPVDVMPPCDGSPGLVTSLTDAQNEAQVYDLLGQLIYYLMGDQRRQIGVKAENGQLKLNVSTVSSAGQRTHISTHNRTIDPQLAKPIRWTPELCREMGGAMLITIYETIHKSELTAAQYNS